jgi:hypothetical protein
MDDFCLYDSWVLYFKKMAESVIYLLFSYHTGYIYNVTLHVSLWYLLGMLDNGVINRDIGQTTTHDSNLIGYLLVITLIIQ